MSMRQKMIAGTSIVVMLTIAFIVTMNLTGNKQTYAHSSGDYRTKASGSWSSTLTWEKFNGTSWVAATSAPVSGDGIITIQSGHSITITSNITLSEVVIDAGATLTISSGTLTLANEPGTDATINGTLIITSTLSLASNSNMDVNGLATLKSTGSINFGSSSVINVNGRFKREGGSASVNAANWSINSGGTYQHAMNGGSLLPSASWKTGSTCDVTGIVSSMPANINQIFYNMIWNCPGQTAGFDFNAKFDFVNGDLTIISTGGATLQFDYQGNNNTTNIGGNLNIQGGSSFGCANGSAVFNIGGSYIQSGGTFAFNVAGVASYGNTSTTLNIAGDLVMTGGTMDLTQSTANNAAIGKGHINLVGNINLSGTANLTQTSADSHGEICFAGTAVQTYVLNNRVTNKIDYIINSGATVRCGALPLTSSGIFSILSGGHMMMGSPSGITASSMAGNVQVTGTRTYSTGADYTYEGTSAQVTGNGLPATVHNLTINNSSDVTLTQTVGVSNLLTLTSGRLITGSSEVSVTNTSESSVAGYSTTAYVIGNLRRSVLGSGAYDFPLGTVDNYEPATLTLSSATGFSNILGSFVQTLPILAAFPLINVLASGVPVVDMLNYGYWAFTPNSSMSGGTYTITLNEKGATNLNSNPQSYCVLKRPNSLAPWSSLGTHNSNTQSMSNGVVTAVRSALTGFSHFGIGKSGGATLPIKLISFDASLKNNAVDLEWATAVEINNNFFTIERSSDGEHFETVFTKSGAGNSTTNHYYEGTDYHPLTGYSYYRLKQTDFDGHYTYSEVKTVKIGDVSESAALKVNSIYPNPFRESFNLNFTSSTATEVTVSIVSAGGQLVKEDKFTSEAGFNSYQFTDNVNMKSGVYYVVLKSGNEKSVKTILKE